MTGADNVRRPARILLTAVALGLGATLPTHADPLAAGAAAHGRGDYVTAARLLTPLAQHGYPRAQTMLGFMYESGQGVPQDYDAAAYWYRQSAERGDAKGIVVDTHVRRLSQRLGLTKQEDPVKIERDLMKIVPREDWARFPHLLIWHGRRICDARRPLCSECVVHDLCPSSRVD